MCNNSPAEATSPENGWRSSVEPTLNRQGNHLTCLGNMYALTSRKNVVIPSKVSDVSQPGGITITDLGGSSKYSSETLEDQCGEGFHVNSS